MRLKIVNGIDKLNFLFLNMNNLLILKLNSIKEIDFEF